MYVNKSIIGYIRHAHIWSRTGTLSTSNSQLYLRNEVDLTYAGNSSMYNSAEMQHLVLLVGSYHQCTFHIFKYIYSRSDNKKKFEILYLL